jgi:NTE family protein
LLNARRFFILVCSIMVFGVRCGSAQVPGPRVMHLTPEYGDTVHTWNTILPYRTVRRPKVGLVLSGGGARGIAQIGVLKVLERYRIPIDFISATSLGAVVGGLYAAGYTPHELDSIARATRWDDILSLTEETKRRELFVDQKLVEDRSFLVIRFDGFQPVLPPAVSSGQRFTNYLNTLALQGVYHPDPSFDDLRIPFRAVSTDLISGRRVILDRGSLAEALRASATVPLVFNPIEKDSMKLIDGGLRSNIPVDVARNAGCDLVIVVNSTSGLRGADELNAPWQTADQILGIMMILPDSLELRLADIVITPEIGRHGASDFTNLDSLIQAGEDAATSAVPEILKAYRNLERGSDTDTIAGSSTRVVIDHVGDIPLLSTMPVQGPLTVMDIRHDLDRLYSLGDYQDVYADVAVGLNETHISYTAVHNPILHVVEIAGCSVINSDELVAEFSPMFGHPVNSRQGQSAIEDLIRKYRAKGYSLAHIDSIAFDPAPGKLRIVVNEGILQSVEVRGSERTEDPFVLSVFPLEPGDVFKIEKATEGITNINSTKLFDFVYLEVNYSGVHPRLTIRLKERPSQLLKLGLRADNERNLQASIDIRDENFSGSGLELGLTLSGGSRNKSAVLEYKANRWFNTVMTFNLSGFFSVFDTYQYGDNPNLGEDRFERIRLGEYRDRRYGARLSLGAQLERFGNATVELSLQNVQLLNLENLESLEDRFRLSKIRIGTIVDSKDKDPFPTSGIAMEVSYEFAFKGLGSQVGYNALRFQYESFSTIADRLTLHPRITFGFADRTMPLSEQFRLGGLDSFFGTPEDDRRGRQMLVFNFEYIYRLPFRVIFDTYLSARYDLGTISANPEEIKFSNFRHGIGLELGFDTPIGVAAVAVGKSFYFAQDLPHNPIQQGPFLFYFVVGYPL